MSETPWPLKRRESRCPSADPQCARALLTRQLRRGRANASRVDDCRAFATRRNAHLPVCRPHAPQSPDLRLITMTGVLRLHSRYPTTVSDEHVRELRTTTMSDNRVRHDSRHTDGWFHATAGNDTRQDVPRHSNNAAREAEACFRGRWSHTRRSPPTLLNQSDREGQTIPPDFFHPTTRSNAPADPVANHFRRPAASFEAQGLS